MRGVISSRIIRLSIGGNRCLLDKETVFPVKNINMYTSFYKLKIKPFQLSSDPDFMWLGKQHKEALATLKYGILHNQGFLLLTGDVGTGKTTLIHALIQSLTHDIICTSVPDPSLSKLDFFNYIAASFGIEQEFSSKGTFLVQFRKFLLDAYDNKKKVLLIIDESQLLTQELLEEIRLLSNIEKTNTKLINIFFIGQNELIKIISPDLGTRASYRSCFLDKFKSISAFKLHKSIILQRKLGQI